MGTDKEIIEQFILALAQSVKDALPTNTGKTYNSIQTEITENSGTIFAPAWIGVFQDGRKPGTMPPVSPIQEWIDSKGLVGKTKSGKAMTSNSLAWAMAMNMKNNGNTLWRALNGGEIAYTPMRIEFDKIFSKDRIDSLVNVFAGKYQTIIESQIINLPG